MIYRLLHWVSGIMLHWFYSEIRVEGAASIPQSDPMLIAVNHPNAMVDSLIAAWIVPRRLRMTAKATLLNNPLVGFLFRLIGVVPLSRASDQLGGAAHDRGRNRQSFDEIVGALRKGGAVLIFPEGRSNSDALMPLKTGLARIALEARARGVRSLSIVPIGLNFENKAEPSSRVLARVGAPISIDSWRGDSPRELTDVLAERLSEIAGAYKFPPRQPPGCRPHRNPLVRAVSWWGRTTHEIPVRFARNIAIARSKEADEPAMLTMLFGMALVIASYAIHLSVIGLLTRSFLLCLLYLATLIAGAYWTAFEAHRR
jgi:1-acyl-sn-glycerol-3-phosphate acyltransferase